MADQRFRAPTSAAATTNARAGFGPRLGAYLVDAVVVGILWAALDVAFKRPGHMFDWLAAMVYFVIGEGGGRGQTIGKAVAGIQVRSVDGGPIGYGRAVLRFLGRIISASPFFLGYVWMLWDLNEQTWHDKIANTVVAPR